MGIDVRFLKGDHVILGLGDDVFSDVEAEVATMFEKLAMRTVYTQRRR